MTILYGGKPMRRKDKEITDRQQIDEILSKAEIIRLAVVDNGLPYIVAMNFAYVDGFIYMHSAKKAGSRYPEERKTLWLFKPIRE
jgi:nitroimidazol reductase NimA-like FMN-containing flavoprotein (pyridoxamine 5'-phosphate oxidase superfamily)